MSHTPTTTVAPDITEPATADAPSPTITATAVIQLSASGRRASLLAGSDGRRTQRRILQLSAADAELIQVNTRGEATLTLTPRIVATSSGLLRRRDMPEYDNMPSDEQLLADARAQASLRRAYDTQRRAALDAAKEAFAQEFMRDDARRALVHPPPTPQRCACRQDRRLLIFRDTDVGLAAAVPVEAHRRFRADLASRARTNRARREHELATYHAKRAFMATWIGEHGSDDQRARLAAGRLADAEMYEAIADRVFAPLHSYPRYTHHAHGDLVARYQRENEAPPPRIVPEQVRIESSLVVHLTAPQWTGLTAMQAALPAATFSVRRYRIYWSERPGRQDPQLVQLTVLAKYRLSPLTLVRSFQLSVE
jgi:hypothetical protein